MSTLTPVPQALQDPKTKIVFYLESDRRHVAAISPAGKIIWCSEIIPSLEKIKGNGIKPEAIDNIRLEGDDSLRVNIVGEGFGGMGGRIDKKTGKFFPGEVS